MDRLLVPLDEAMHQLGDIGRTKLYELFDKHEIVRVRVGRRAFVLSESIAAYVGRLSETADAPGETADAPSETAGAPVSRD